MYFVCWQKQLLGDKVKGRISKRVFQESKARQNFRKTNISYPLRGFEKNLQYQQDQGFLAIILTPSCMMLKNGQSHFKNLALFTPQDF